MPNAHFVFIPTSYDREQLLPQVSRALEKQTELASRQRYPGLWRTTDSLRSISKGRSRSRLRTRVMSVVCLILGVFLLVPGLMDPQELAVPLVTGAVAVAVGIGGLCGGRKKRKNPFDRSAGILLSGLRALPEAESLQVCFSPEGMKGAETVPDAYAVPWEGFTCAVETADTFLLVYEEKALLLQKKDLKEGTPEEFRALLATHIQNFVSL